MNDQELNIKIAKHFYDNVTMSDHSNAVECTCRRKGSIFYIDYCNNWNDLMPLFVKYELSLWQDKGIGCFYANQCKRCDHGDYLGDVFENDIENENPQRALAECLLKVLKNK